jgi:hypothetical protein
MIEEIKQVGRLLMNSLYCAKYINIYLSKQPHIPAKENKGYDS